MSHPLVVDTRYLWAGTIRPFRASPRFWWIIRRPNFRSDGHSWAQDPYSSWAPERIRLRKKALPESMVSENKDGVSQTWTRRPGIQGGNRPLGSRRCPWPSVNHSYVIRSARKLGDMWQAKRCLFVFTGPHVADLMWTCVCSKETLTSGSLVHLPQALTFRVNAQLTSRSLKTYSIGWASVEWEGGSCQALLWPWLALSLRISPILRSHAWEWSHCFLLPAKDSTQLFYRKLPSIWAEGDLPWVKQKMSKWLLAAIKGSRRTFILACRKHLTFTHLSLVHLLQVEGCQRHLMTSG